MYRIVLIGIALQLLACGAPKEAVLSWDGYGPVSFGARLQDVENKLGPAAGPKLADKSACGYTRFSSLPRVSFMVENGVVTRAEVEPGAPNVLGVEVGASLAEVKAKHANVMVQPHKYNPKGHYLIFKSPDKTKAIVMEEADGKIKEIRAGLEPSVEYVEGCS